MATVSGLRCCGWAELYGVQNYSKNDFNTIIATVSMYNGGRIAQMFCSASASEKPRSCGATAFAAELKRQKLGEVTKLPVFKNANSGNWIISYVWIVDLTAVNTFCAKQKIGRFATVKTYA